MYHTPVHLEICDNRPRSLLTASRFLARNDRALVRRVNRHWPHLKPGTRAFERAIVEREEELETMRRVGLGPYRLERHMDLVAMRLRLSGRA